jgi:hypothetical protein
MYTSWQTGGLRCTLPVFSMDVDCWQANSEDRGGSDSIDGGGGEACNGCSRGWIGTSRAQHTELVTVLFEFLTRGLLEGARRVGGVDGNQNQWLALGNRCERSGERQNEGHKTATAVPQRSVAAAAGWKPTRLLGAALSMSKGGMEIYC